MDYRKCKNCGYEGELDDFQALGTNKRYELCNSCWEEQKRDEYAEITVNLGGHDYEYMSFELSPDSFNTLLDTLQSEVGFSDGLKEAIRAGGVIPFMQRGSGDNVIFRR